MAQTAANKPRPVNDPVDPTDHAHNPDKDAGAPLGTDAEVGRQGAPASAEEAYVVDSNGEVRAGPGDAGMQDAPRVLDDPQDKPPRGRGTLIALLLAGPVLLLFIWMLLI